MSEPAGRMRAKKKLKGANEGGSTTAKISRGRKRKVNLLKKIIKETNEKEKKYFGKRKREWNGRRKQQQQ